MRKAMKMYKRPTQVSEVILVQLRCEMPNCFAPKLGGGAAMHTHAYNIIYFPVAVGRVNPRRLQGGQVWDIGVSRPYAQSRLWL